MTITEAMAPGVEAFRPAFRQSTNEPTWLANYRRAGVEQFSATGLPTTKDEGWKYTSLRPLARENIFLQDRERYRRRNEC